jgi:hypothetical protein
MSTYRKPPVQLGRLWLKYNPDGSPYLTGRMGTIRVVVRPASFAGAPVTSEDGTTYVLEFAETADTIPAIGGDAR